MGDTVLLYHCCMLSHGQDKNDDANFHQKTMGSKTDSLVAFQSQLHNVVKHLTQLHIVFSLMSNSDT